MKVGVILCDKVLEAGKKFLFRLFLENEPTFKSVMTEKCFLLAAHSSEPLCSTCKDLKRIITITYIYISHLDRRFRV